RWGALRVSAKVGLAHFFLFVDPEKRIRPMKGSEVLRIVDQMHHEKNIDREIIFSGIEAALQLAAAKKYGEESGVSVTISRDTGDIVARKGEEDIEPSV